MKYSRLLYYYAMEQSNRQLKDGAKCNVINGTHKGKSGTVSDINTSKTGQITMTVTQQDGVRFKTLARNVKIVN